MDNIFNINMTSSEARKALYTAYDGMTKEEQDKLYNEQYRPIADEILRRELELGSHGVLMS